VKLIRSIIRPSKLDDLKEAFRSVNIVAFTVAEVRDYAPEYARTMAFMGTLYEKDDLRRLDVTVVVDDQNADAVVEVIVRIARTRSLEDGHVCVLPVEHRYTIHTGFRESP
jgi:nitrogen regulatory protein P-II 1